MVTLIPGKKIKSLSYPFKRNDGVTGRVDSVQEKHEKVVGAMKKIDLFNDKLKQTKLRESSSDVTETPRGEEEGEMIGWTSLPPHRQQQQKNTEIKERLEHTNKNEQRRRKNNKQTGKRRKSQKRKTKKKTKQNTKASEERHKLLFKLQTLKF